MSKFNKNILFNTKNKQLSKLVSHTVKKKKKSSDKHFSKCYQNKNYWHREQKENEEKKDCILSKTLRSSS